MVSAIIQQELGMSNDDFVEMAKVGAMFYNQGNFEKSRTIFEALVELNPESAEANSALGALLTRTQEDERAVGYLTKAIEINKFQIAPYVNLGEIYIRQKRTGEAVNYLQQAILLDPNENDFGANRARAMILGIYQAIKFN